MAINKNFVVKNGIEVNDNLIIADADQNKVGIGTSVLTHTFNVNGGIGATDVTVTGITTVLTELRVGTSGTVFSVIAGPVGTGQSIGVGTSQPGYLLDVRSPVSTGQTALYVQGDVQITGDLIVDDIVFDDATIQDLNVTGIGTIATFNVTGVSTFTGIGTFQSDLYVGGDLYVADDLVIDELTARNINITGIGTIETLDVNIGTIDYLSNVNLDVTGIGTIATLDVATGTIDYLSNTNLDVAGIATIATLGVTGVTTTQFLEVTGISTFTGSSTFQDSVYISGIASVGTAITMYPSSGIVSATAFYGDGSNLTGFATGLTATIGVSSTGTVIGAGVSQLDFRTNANAVLTVDSTVAGVATVTIAPSVSLGLVIALGG